MKVRHLWFLLVPAAIVAGYFLWQAQPRKVVVAKAVMGPAVELVYASGFVEATQPVEVASRVTAPVVRVLVREGDRVRRDQPLVLLDDAEQRGAIAQTDAQVTQTGLDETRKRTLFEEGWVTRAALEQAVAAARVARASAASARARAEQYAVRAGIDGVVMKRDVEPGDLAVPTRTLMLLGDPAHNRVTATVDERDIPRLRIGQQALMSTDAWPGRVIRGRVSELTPGGDPAQRAFRARIALDETGLPTGLTLEVNIVTARIGRAVLVPSDAVVADHVWVVENGRAYRRAVRRGIVGSTTVQIAGGLRAGDHVVRTPSATLRDGERVEPAAGSAP